MPHEVARHLLSELAPDIAGRFAAGTAVRVYSSFEHSEMRWRTAQASCAAYGFQAYDWLAAWQRELGARQGWEVCIVELTDADDRTLMLLPLGRQRKRGIRYASFLGGEITDYNAPLLHPDFDASCFAALWPLIVRLMGGVDVFRVRRMPLNVEGVANPLVALPGMRHTEQAHAATLTPTYAEFQKARSAKMFADTRRQLRRLNELGAVKLLIDAPPDLRAAVTAGMAQQKARRWHETGSRDLFAEPGYLDFYQHLAAQGLSGGEIVVSALYVDDKLVATHWGMRYGGRFYWLMPGYQDGEWARYSVGRILLDAVVQHCIAEGLAVFDLTVGDEGYKMQWADHMLPLYAGQQGHSLRGKIVVAVGEAYRQLRARARDNERLRSLVRRLRGQRSGSAPNNQ
ncbi:GNAT family N-acetyltransferase [Herbaspirillum rhizosphaerae]|uniref:GNAT family N-acetyltransferase n=1 Tax=Herbaspirillum rhizosphaerae TaxID=346179 RepID=UPI00067B3116|nr:GNAT family N-acetyltransferase [Herbaspirillum rhizosphaerae]